MLVKAFVGSLAVGRVARGILQICILGCLMARVAPPPLGLSTAGSPSPGGCLSRGLALTGKAWLSVSHPNAWTFCVSLSVGCDSLPCNCVHRIDGPCSPPPLTIKGYFTCIKWGSLLYEARPEMAGVLTSCSCRGLAESSEWPGGQDRGWEVGRGRALRCCLSDL